MTEKFKRYPNYKKCDLVWLDKIPEHWEILSFRNILIERNEKNNPIKSRERLSLSINKGVTLYSDKTTNLDRFKDDFSKYKLAQEGDLVLNSMNMIVGAVGVSKYFGCVSPVYYTFYADQNNCNSTKYYEYLFRSKVIQGVLFTLGRGLIAKDRGDGKYNTLRLKVSRGDLRSLKLPHPNYIEQQQIASFLNFKISKINRFILKKQKLIELLNEQKTAIISKVVSKGINPNVTLKKSGIDWLGDVPEHWELNKLKFLLKKPVAGAWGTEPKNDNNDIICIRVADFQDFKVKTDNLTLRNIEPKAEQILRVGDLLLEKSGGGEKTPVGRVVMFSHNIKAVSSNFISKISPRNEKVLTEYLLYVFKLINSVKWNFKSLKQTTGIQNIDTYSYLDNWVYLPALSEQEQIVKYIQDEFAVFDGTIDKIEKELALTEEFKTSLIDEVVTGKVDVRHFEISNFEEALTEFDDKLIAFEEDEEVELKNQEMENG